MNYGISRNLTLAEVFQEVLDYLLIVPFANWSPNDRLEKWINSKNTEYINFTRISQYLENSNLYANDLERLLLSLTKYTFYRFDWSSQDIGTIMVKSFLELSLTLDSNKMAEIDDAFTLKGERVSLTDIVSMYNIVNVKSLKTITPAKFEAVEPCNSFDLFSDCEYFPYSKKRVSEFDKCFDTLKQLLEEPKNAYWDDPTIEKQMFVLPCQNVTKYET